jgi:hypothetical protein
MTFAIFTAVSVLISLLDVIRYCQVENYYISEGWAAFIRSINLEDFDSRKVKVKCTHFVSSYFTYTWYIPVKYESSIICNNYKVAIYYLATSNSCTLSCEAIVLSCSICGNCRNLNGTMLSIDVTMSVWNITNIRCLVNNTWMISHFINSSQHLPLGKGGDMDKREGNSYVIVSWKKKMKMREQYEIA